MTAPPASSVIGQLASTSSHVSYQCRVHNEGEREVRPPPSDYAFGRFVSVDLQEEDGSHLGESVGVIVDTVLVDPDFGGGSSHLEEPDIEVTMPGYLQGVYTLIEVIAIGWRSREGSYVQGVPPHAPRLGAALRAMNESGAREFHMPRPGQFQIDYLTFLTAQNQPLISQLVLQKIDWLQQAFPDERQSLGVIYNLVAWRSVVGALR